MGIDHGLGGKDGAKSREKRAKKAERQKVKAHNSITVVKKKTEVIFDDEARVKWLTGFRQRKTERRKFGLAMQIVKDKQAHKDALKINRKSIKEARGETINGVDVVQADPAADNSKKKNSLAVPELPGGEGEEGEEPEGEKQTFEDAATVGMFGGSVAVQIGVGIGEEEPSDLQEEEVAAAAARLRAREQARKPQLSKLEKAVRKVQQSGALNKKKKKKREGEDAPDTRGGRHGPPQGKKGFKKAKIEKKQQAAKSLLSKVKGGGVKSFKGGKR